MDRTTAVMTWRDVCGSDTVMAIGIVTGSMLEDFAARIEAAERKRCAKVERELSVARMALEAIRSHWREFGPDCGFDETLEDACKVLDA